jgi:hypothetical protein
MGLIGMLHYRKYPHDVIKAYPYAAVAKMEEIPFFYFSFDAVDFEKRKILGWVYEERQWKQKQMNFPTVIINSCNPKTKKQSEILQRLRKEAIFTSHPVGNKLKVYKKLKRGGKFAEYLIPSSLLTEPEELIIFINESSRAVMKPVKGNKGKKVFFLEKDGDSYKITDGSDIYTFNKTELLDFIKHHIKEQDFLYQSYIQCKTLAGLSYDFRLHIQKNGAGEWEINLIYPRISSGSKLVSNISSGGYRGDFESFLIQEFAGNAKTIQTALEKFARGFPKYLESLYNHPFDELGLDVGIDENQRLWLFEVNWRPGSKNREFEVAKRIIPYCQFLMK